MARIEVSTMVSAPAEVVFNYADAHENYHEIYQEASGLEWSNPRHEVGTKLKMTLRSAGVSVPLELETTEVVPGARVAGIYTSGITGSWEWRFEPTGDATRMTTVTDYELPMGLLGQIADKTVVERDNRAFMQRAMGRIKANVEARARAS